MRKKIYLSALLVGLSSLLCGEGVGVQINYNGEPAEPKSITFSQFKPGEDFGAIRRCLEENQGSFLRVTFKGTDFVARDYDIFELVPQ